MATKKKLLQAAAGTAAAGGESLSVENVFSTYLYEGNGSSQVIRNGIALGDQYDGGSAEFTDPDTGYPIQLDGTISLTGDFTVEAFINITTISSTNNILGSDYGGLGTNNQFGISASSGYLYTYSDPTIRESTTAVSVGTWQHVAISRSGSTIYFWIDGVAAGTATDSNTFSLTCIGALEGYTGTDASFEGYMSNLRVSNNARYTSAFTAPTSDLADDANTLLLALQGTDPFTDQSGTYTLTADSSVKASTFGPYYAEAGEGGLVWIKSRSLSGDNWIFDSERSDYFIKTNNTDQQYTSTLGYSNWSFNSDGLSWGAGSSYAFMNDSGTTFASWTFRKAPKFFDVQTFTSASSGNTTFNHNLGSTPACVIIKNTQTSDPWLIYHVETGNDKYLAFDTSAAGTLSGSFSVNSTSVTVSSFLMYTSQSYVAYLFAHNDGDGEFGPDGDADIIKCGSYTGTGGEHEVNLGFEPQWVMIKNATASGSEWAMFDTMRGIPTDGVTRYLAASNSGAEQFGGDITGFIEVTSTGFRLPNNNYSWVNSNGNTHIYIAIRRGPMAVPTDATDVFDVRAGFTGTDRPQFPSGFVTDMGLLLRTSGANPRTSARLIQGQMLKTNLTDAETANSNYVFDYQNGWLDSGLDTTYYGYSWRRAPNYFDVVAYTGNNTAGNTISHNLGVVPEMMWIKSRSNAVNWIVYHKDLNGSTNPEDYYLILNGTNAETNDSSGDFFNSTAPTATNFTLGGSYWVNGTSNIAYLFASVDGVSKVGSFTHTNGTATNVDCGFSNGARFVLLKRYNTTGSWIVFDAERGIVSGNDPYLALNTTDAEVTSNDVIDPYSSGFTVASGFLATGDWIFYAIA